MSENARKPSVKLKLQGEERTVTALLANFQIGAYPKISVQHHPDTKAENKAIKLSSDDVTKEIGKRQEVIFNTRENPDIDLTVEEKEAGTLEFKGYLCNPRYSFSAYNVTVADEGLIDYAKLETLNYSIYEFPKSSTKEVPKIEDSKSLIEYVKKFIEELYKNGPSKDETAEISTKDKEAQHEINKQGHKLFIKILENSVESAGWEKLPQQFVKLGDPTCVDLRVRLRSIFCSAGGSFLTKLGQFCHEFQLIYIPGIKDPGKLANRTKLFKEAEALEIEPVSMIMSAGSHTGLFPVRYVAVYPPKVSASYKEAAPQAIKDMYIAYPQLEAGTIATSIPTTGPLWLNYNLTDVQNLKSSQEVKRGFQPSEVEAQKKENEQKLTERKKILEEILSDWGMSTYAWVSLERSVASIIVPLNFKPELGKRYEVKNKEGKALFSGFLIGIQHNLSTDGRGQALTTLDFSHIMAGDFKLPGLDEMK